ncbi:transcriptional repressor [Massospora cicadina]|nr:transcriptional repressor [Massospora cicadina]
MPEKFSVFNASGLRVSLLSEDYPPCLPPVDKKLKRHLCNYPKCGKAFSTRGHLSRHHLIHTGEKNFRCMLPHCKSKFSRQDNMMQHYRAHFLAKSKHLKSIYSDFHSHLPSIHTPDCTPPRLPSLNVATNYYLCSALHADY